MDIQVPGLRDRRIAASDERTSVRGGAIFGRGTHGARSGLSLPGQAPFDREAFDITSIILHQTSGHQLTAADLPLLDQDAVVASRARVDRITAHFVVLSDGTLAYSRDVQYILNDAGGRHGIDIEFAGRYGHQRLPHGERLSAAAIRNARLLLKVLRRAIPSLATIHPHGQVQTGPTAGRGHGGKWDSCCGPDIWVNVGAWATQALQLSNTPPTGYYPDHQISPAQANSAYAQLID